LTLAFFGVTQVIVLAAFLADWALCHRNHRHGREM
jgi:hypothetical protein